MIQPAPIAVQHCETCGYELSGLGASGHCPECGAAFDALTPFSTRTRVNWGRAVRHACLPAAIAGLILHITAKAAFLQAEVGLAVPTLFFGWLVLALVMPRAVAQDVAEVRWTRRSRRWPIAMTTLAGTTLNVCVFLAMSWVFFGPLS